VEGTNTRNGDGRRLVLGFDAGCMTCSELARRIEAQAGGGLEVRGLHDPQMKHWREQALGKDAAWKPTLIEISGGQTKAWTGGRMGLALVNKLGLVSAWRVMQALGEMRDESADTSLRRELDASSFSRGQFLKGAGGTVLAFSLFSGFASSAFADTKQEAIEKGKQAERAIALMERHMKIKSNGTLSLDEKGLENDIRSGRAEGIDRSVFAALKQNLADTNAKILNSKAKAEDLFPTVSAEATEKRTISPKGCAGINWVQYFWWGRRSWIDNCNTNKLVRRLYANMGVFAIIACFPVGGVPVAMASAIIGLGGFAIDATNRGRGVYINYILRLVAVRVRPQ
jgi:hypothetical protein